MNEFPAPDTSAHYWRALAEGRLEYQRCAACGHAWLPERSECPNCLAASPAWTRASGRARLVSWVVYHHAYHPWFAARLPYNVAVVELAEGPRLVANIVHGDAPLHIDMPLELLIEREADVALARFKPV